MRKPVGVLQVIDTLGVGGAERLLVTLARSLNREEFDLHILSLRPIAETIVSRELRDLAVPLHCLDSIRLRDIHRFPAFRRLASKHNINVAHTHLGLANTWGLAACGLAGLPAVATIHNIYNERQRLGSVKNAVQRTALAHLTYRVIACAPDVGRYAREELSIAPDHILEIPNAIDPGPYLHVDTAATAKVRHDVLQGREGPLILSVGAIQEAKGHDILVTAIPHMLDTFPGLVVAIAGRFDTNTALVKDRMAHFGVTQNVELLGERSDVPSLYTAADVTVLPSRREALPLTLLEAMVAGTPVVASNVGGIPSVITHETTGYLVPAEDHTSLAGMLVRVLSGPEGAVRVAKQAQRLVLERYGAEQWARHLETIYRQAAEQ